MKKHFLIILFFSCLSMNFGCKKFLTQHPSSEILDDDAYSSTAGIFSILNGLYIQMSGNALYGGNMTMTITDVLAQYYYNQPYTYSYFANGTYTDANAHAISDNVWDSAYSTILQANVFITHVKELTNTNILSNYEQNLVLGEAYAIRGFLEFDLLRLYGPVYSMDSTSALIVYNYASSQLLNSFLPSNTIMNNVWKDLDSAISYLQNDPVRSVGVNTVASNDLSVTLDETFFQRRNLRLNYFAVQALQARVALYRGDKSTAGNIATALINELNGKNFFRWSPDAYSLTGSTNFDPVFSSEIIFSLYNSNLYAKYLSYFAPSLNPGAIFRPNQEGLNAFYEDDVTNATDFRLRSQWIISPSQNTKDYTFSKYQEPSTETLDYRYMQPLIRKSEIYYIAAESTNDFSYLDTVRTHRGLGNLDTQTAVLQAELAKEYRKEFWGEGQLFFYYKRMNQSTIPTTNTKTSSTSYSSSRYILPIPVLETTNH